MALNRILGDVCTKICFFRGQAIQRYKLLPVCKIAAEPLQSQASDTIVVQFFKEDIMVDGIKCLAEITKDPIAQFTFFKGFIYFPNKISDSMDGAVTTSEAILKFQMLYRIKNTSTQLVVHQAFQYFPNNGKQRDWPIVGVKMRFQAFAFVYRNHSGDFRTVQE